MRSKRRIQKNAIENNRKMNCEYARKMARILQMERERHQATVTELRTILKEERDEINTFLKDMKKILDDMPTFNTTSHLNQQINVIQIEYKLN